MNSQTVLSDTQEKHLLLYPTRWKMLFGIAGALLFVVAGIWIIFWIISFYASRHISIGLVSISFFVVYMVVGLVSIGFFGLCGLSALASLIHPFPVLMVNEEGFHYRNPFWNTFVAWKEIAAISSRQGHSECLSISLSEAGKETFFARYPRRWHISRFNSRFFRDVSVISLAPIVLPIPAQQVLATIHKRYQKQIEEYHITIL